MSDEKQIGGRSQAAVFQDDLTELMEALGMEVYARPKSPHRVVQEEVIPYAKNLKARVDRLEKFVVSLEKKATELQFATHTWDRSPPMTEADDG